MFLLKAKWEDIPRIAYDFQKELELKDIPTFQDINDFYHKYLDPEKLEKEAETLALLTIDLAGITEISLACDSTGLRIADASRYYEQRAKKRAVFVKLHVMMETNTRVIISAEITDPKTGDVTVLKEKFLPKIKELIEKFRLSVKSVSADSAYDDENVHTFLNALGVRDGIGIRKSGRGNPRSPLRRVPFRMRSLPWLRRLRGLRWVLESMFKVFKRLFGDVVRDRRVSGRPKGVWMRILLWNFIVLLSVSGLLLGFILTATL